jgi:hypothetical protein
MLCPEEFIFSIVEAIMNNSLDSQEIDSHGYKSQMNGRPYIKY